LRPDFDVDVIDLATAWLPDVMSADPSAPRPQAVKDLAPWLEAADAFVVVTPEHHQTFPASLKNAIDWYDEEWHAKPVGFLSYGGSSSGLCAVAALRQVFGDVHAVPPHASTATSRGFSLHAHAHTDVDLELRGRVLVGLEPGTVFR
jgi:NAD(P)H-dependent FMN reductase